MLTGDTLTFEAGGNEANVAKGNATIGLELADTPSGAGMTEPGDGSPVLSGPKSMNGVIAKTSVGSINLSGSTQGGISGPIAPRERFAAILRKTARISTCKTGFPLRAFFTIGLLLTALSLSQERALAQTVTESCAGYTGTIPGLAWPGSYSTDQYLTSAGTCAASPAAGDLVTVLQATSTDGLNISIVGEIEGTRVGPICGGVVGGSGRYLFAINTNHACTMTRWVGNRNVTVTFSTAANISNVSGGTADFQVVFGTINYTSVADTTPPTAVLSGLAPLIGLAGDSVTLTFSEEIQGVSLSDLALTNLTASNLNTSDNTVFTFDVVPVADGPIAINLPANSATDLAGNGNQVSNTVSGTGDATPPTVTIAPLSGPVAGEYTAAITLSEASTDFNLADLTLTNATATLSGSGTSYTATLTPVADGRVALSVAAGTFSDAVGNTNTAASNEVTSTYDTTAPTVSIGPLTGPVAGEYTAVITLSETSTDFNLADLTLTNATATLSGSGTSYTATLTPVADGPVALSVAAGTFSDSGGNTNTAASNEVIVTYDTTSPTVSIAPLTGPVAGEYTAVITLSEASTDFLLADLTLTNATATLSGSGTSYTATLTPVADGRVALSVAAGTFSDAVGNTNTAASNEVTSTYDTTAPTVSISTSTKSVTGPETVSISVTFSEDVTGFEMSDFTVANGAVTNLQGSGADYVARVAATGRGDLEVSIPAGAASDPSGNANTASNTLSIANEIVEQTQKIIAQFMQTRASQLLSSQPDLTGFLSGGTQGSFDFAMTSLNGTFDFASQPGSDSGLWTRLNGSWTREDTAKSQYVFGAIGHHFRVSSTLLIGGMVEFDYLSQTDEAARINGYGWLAGPYAVARLPDQPLFLEGRLLYGQTSNDISPLGTYTDSFETERILAQLKVSGEIGFERTLVTPSVKLSYTSDDQEAYSDSFGNVIPEQGLQLFQGELGLDVRHQVGLPTDSASLELMGGFSMIGSSTQGSGNAALVVPTYDGGRAKVMMGANYILSNGGDFLLDAYYDGIGVQDYESYGLQLGFKLAF